MLCLTVCFFVLVLREQEAKKQVKKMLMDDDEMMSRIEEQVLANIDARMKGTSLSKNIVDEGEDDEREDATLPTKSILKKKPPKLSSTQPDRDEIRGFVIEALKSIAGNKVKGKQVASQEFRSQMKNEKMVTDTPVNKYFQDDSFEESPDGVSPSRQKVTSADLSEAMRV
jgi:hypothetical protein